MLLNSCTDENSEGNFIWKQCFSEKLYFSHDMKNNKKIYGILDLEFSKNLNPNLRSGYLISPACHGIKLSVIIKNDKKNLEKISSASGFEFPKCSGDVCDLKSARKSFRIVASGDIKFMNNGDDARLEIQNINELDLYNNAPISLQYMKIYKEVYLRDFLFINPNYKRQ